MFDKCTHQAAMMINDGHGCGEWISASFLKAYHESLINRSDLSSCFWIESYSSFPPQSASSDACLDGFAVRAIKVEINLCPNEWVCPWRLFIASWRRAVCHIYSPPLGIDALKQACISASYFSKPESPRNPTLNGVYIPV